jgi:Ca2+-binding RTX toxin-like protein
VSIGNRFWGGSLALLTVLCIQLEVARDAAARPGCLGHKGTVIGSNGSNHLHGTRGPDVIVGRGGNDRISGDGGRDLICSGPGNDVIFGGNSADRILGSQGQDLILGGPGADTVNGGAGNDRINGGQQDDKLIGAGDDDVLLGAEAFNTLRGGPGNDVTRDGFTVDGGPGSDWISFATATHALGHFGLTPGTQDNIRKRNIENVIGTRLADTILGGPAAASGTVRGLGYPAHPQFDQPDKCFDFAVIDCGGPYGPRDQPIVLVDTFAPDPGVTVIGGPAADHYSVSRTASGVRVVSPTAFSVGPGCSRENASVVSCAVPSHLGYLFALGMDGDDEISIDGSLGAGTSIEIDAGGGSDTVRGGPGDEDVYAGEEETPPNPVGPNSVLPSVDTLVGGGGDDALKTGLAGPDRVYGGAGADQLESSNPCGGGLLNGGPGRADIADFVSAGGVRAHLGGVARQFPPTPGNGPCAPMRVARDIELMEGGMVADILIGDAGSNALIVGHEGDDLIKGLGGNDHLSGEQGDDTLVGGGGSDILDCGAGGGRARRDAADPPPRHCH